MSFGDPSLVSPKPETARKQSGIWSMMVEIGGLVLVLGLVIVLSLVMNWVRGQYRSIVKDDEVTEWFDQLLKDNRPAVLDRYASTSGGLVNWSVHFHGQARTPTRHSIMMDLDYKLGALGEETYRVVLSSEGRSVTKPIEDLIQHKIDLKAEFPEAFR